MYFLPWKSWKAVVSIRIETTLEFVVRYTG